MMLWIYIGAINILTFALFGFDKWKAKHDRWRIKEATLLGMSLIGGCFGGFVGMRFFHHKTRKEKFFIGIPLMCILWIVVLLYKNGIIG